MPLVSKIITTNPSLHESVHSAGSHTPLSQRLCCFPFCRKAADSFCVVFELSSFVNSSEYRHSTPIGTSTIFWSALCFLVQGWPCFAASVCYAGGRFVKSLACLFTLNCLSAVSLTVFVCLSASPSLYGERLIWSHAVELQR